jgi:ABC-type transport system involved in multi-copper enzyme maturation permease subunit
LAAFFVIIIFKENYENGSDLIIIAKQITRIKVVLAKYLALFTLLAILTLLGAAISLLSLINPYVDPKTIGDLFLSVFIFQGVILFVFGAIATIVTVKLNKI